MISSAPSSRIRRSAKRCTKACSRRSGGRCTFEWIRTKPRSHKDALPPVRAELVEALFFFTVGRKNGPSRSEEHTSELQSLMRISYAVFCLKKKTNKNKTQPHHYTQTYYH